MPPEGESEATEPEAESAIELGPAETVRGAPIGRIAARLTWPQERSEIERKVGDVEIRTPDGPRTLAALLEEVETAYFARRQDFESAVRDVMGSAPIPTE